MPTPPHATRRLAVALLGAAALLGACSAGGDEGDAAAKPTTTATTAAPSATTEVEETTTTEAEDTSTTVDEDSLAAWEEAFGTAIESSDVAGTADPDVAGPTDETAEECATRLWLEIVTVEALGAAGYAPEDLEDVDLAALLPELVDADQALQLLDASIECGLDPLASVVDGMVEEGLTEEQAWCIVDAVPAGTFEQAIAVAFDQGAEALDGDADYEAVVAAAAQECGLGG